MPSAAASRAAPARNTRPPRRTETHPIPIAPTHRIQPPAHGNARAIAHVTKLATGEPADPSWRATLHFHPDRLVAGTPILERMARDGVYRSQFETRTSNGGVASRLSTLIALAEADDRDPLDDYIEAHVHGVVDLTRDVEALVLDPGYRGPEFVALGLTLARDGRLDPGVIGNASRTGRYHERHLKRVWHYVARFGTPGIRS
jgi:hypothetical protein